MMKHVMYMIYFIQSLIQYMMVIILAVDGYLTLAPPEQQIRIH